MFAQLRTEDDSPFAQTKPKPEVKQQPSTIPKQKSAVTNKPTPRPPPQRITPGTRMITPASSRMPPTVRRPPTTSTARSPTIAARTASSQPVTRAPTSQSISRAPTSRATTRAPSATRSTPLVRTGTAQLSRATSVSRTTTKPAARPTVPTAPVKGKTATAQPSATPAPPNTERPRSGTITKAAFESNTHVVIHIRNNSLEDVKKDLEGLIVFDDAFDDDGFRFDV